MTLVIVLYAGIALVGVGVVGLAVWLGQNPHLRVLAPCLIHPGQTIDIDLTDGTLIVRDTP